MEKGNKIKNQWKEIFCFLFFFFFSKYGKPYQNYWSPPSQTKIDILGGLFMKNLHFKSENIN